MDVPSRELRNSTREVLDRVASGEEVRVTVDGRPVARIVPLPSRPRWVTREQFLRRVVAAQADPELRDDLRSIVGDETTDDLPLP